VPQGANPVKTARIRESDAELIEAGADLTEAIDAAEAYVAKTGAFFLHDASSPDVPLGTATIGDELLTQCAAIDAVYVPMGDTALIRGVASSLKRSGRTIAVIGVVASMAPAYALSWRAGRVIETASANTSADGLAVRRPLAPNVSAIRSLVDQVMEVTEAELRGAVRWLEERERLVTEPSGAASVAALRRDEGRSGTLVALLTGRNRPPSTAGD
jgi:threonine dehydratase